ncbi:MAG: hypothetical protein U5R46_18535 [Gammaproteobacteria bacterium]|nr:hypothetical protein [Gammaproteobacteria bacterium]
MKSRPRETAALLLCLGVVLLFPPIALIFDKPHRLLGIPLPVFYVFGTWLLLVLGAYAVSRILPDTESSD